MDDAAPQASQVIPIEGRVYRADAGSELAVSEPKNLRSSLAAKLRNLGGLFWLTVVVPTVLATLYFGVLASDVYISESR